MKILICVLALAVTILARPEVGDGYRYHQPELPQPAENYETNFLPEHHHPQPIEDQGQTVRIIKQEVQPPRIRTLKIIRESEPEIRTIQILHQHPPPPPLVRQVQILRHSPPPPPEVRTISVVHQPPPPPPQLNQIRLVHQSPPPPPIVKTLKIVHQPAPQPIHHHVKYLAAAPAPVVHHIPAPLPAPAPLSVVGAAPAVGAIAESPISVGPGPIEVGGSIGNYQLLSSSLQGGHSLGPAVLGPSSYGLEGLDLSSLGLSSSGLAPSAVYASGAPAVQVLGHSPAVASAPAPAPLPLSAHAPWLSGSYGGLPIYGGELGHVKK